MNREQSIEKAEIRKWRRHGRIFMTYALINAAMVAMALAINFISPKLTPTIVGLFGMASFVLFVVTATAGVRCMAKYRRYSKYFEATGLTRCTEVNVRQWMKTGDVTK